MGTNYRGLIFKATVVLVVVVFAVAYGWKYYQNSYKYRSWATSYDGRVKTLADLKVGTTSPEEAAKELMNLKVGTTSRDSATEELKDLDLVPLYK